MGIKSPGSALVSAFVMSLLQIGAILVSAQLRLRIFYGSTLGADYQPLPLLVFLLIPLSVIVAVSAGRVIRRLTGRLPFWLSVLLVFVLIVLLLPEFSLLQALYFVLVCLVLGLLVLRPYRHDGAFLSDLRALWESRTLILLWTRITIQSRYSQTMLGILWIVLLPLSTALVFAFVFSQILHTAPLENNVPFLSFFLTALTFWNLFNQSMVNSTSSLLGKMSLMRQVYFPREVLIIVRLFEAVVDTFFTFVLLLLVNLLLGILPSPIYLLLLPVLAIQIAFGLGLMLLISALSVFLRDIPPLVGVVLQILFYLTPIIYPAANIPQEYQFIVLVNPLVAIIDAYRDIILYYRAPDIVSLFYPLVASGVLLYLGYRFFKRRELLLPDYV